MRAWLKTLLILIFIAIYVFFINVVAFYKIAGEKERDADRVWNAYVLSSSSKGTVVEIPVQEKVTVAVHRQRWYGTIEESDGCAWLYLFSLIRLPMKTKTENFLPYHLIFVFLIFSLTLLSSKRRKYIQKEVNVSVQEDIPKYIK